MSSNTEVYIKGVVFDLDNTLYPEDENIFPQLKKRIIEFILLYESEKKGL